MLRNSLLAAVMLLLGANSTLAQTAPLDFIPDDAAVAVVLRHPNELKKKGDALLKKAGIDLDMRPTQAVDFLANYLGLFKGVDYDRPAGAVTFRPEGKRLG